MHTKECVRINIQGEKMCSSMHRYGMQREALLHSLQSGSQYFKGHFIETCKIYIAVQKEIVTRKLR